MSATKVAKLFKNGGSQAVRLPAEFRFEGDEVYITRDERTGDVVLSSRPRKGTLEYFFQRVGELDEDLEFDYGRDLLDASLDKRILFDDVVEDEGA